MNRNRSLAGYRPALASAATAVAAIVATAAAGCGGSGDDSPSSRAPSASREVAGLRFTVSLPRSEFRRGEPIPIKFEIANDGPHTYSISSPGIRPVVGIGITLKRGDRKLVEPLPGAIVAGGAVQTLAPGEAVATDPGAEVPCSLGPDGIPEFDRGCQAPPGVYRVETIFAGGISRVAEDGTRRFVVDLSAPPVEFTIVE